MIVCMHTARLQPLMQNADNGAKSAVVSGEISSALILNGAEQPNSSRIEEMESFSIPPMLESVTHLRKLLGFRVWYTIQYYR